LNSKLKAKIENRDGIDYLSFTPDGMRFPKYSGVRGAPRLSNQARPSTRLAAVYYLILKLK
jgi:hypothetical protein